jgi:hypothetical protein
MDGVAATDFARSTASTDCPGNASKRPKTAVDVAIDAFKFRGVLCTVIRRTRLCTMGWALRRRLNT